MKLFLHEISELGTEVRFTEKDKWAWDAIASADESGAESSLTPTTRRLSGDLILRQVDGVVVVQGKLDTEIELFCSRCASAFRMACTPQISALFCRDPSMAGIAHLDVDKQGRTTGKVVGKLQGRARHAHDFDGEGSVNQDLDITYLSEEMIDLSSILTEQVQLLIPFQPLCSENCKGICAHCGADQNKGRCACAKIQSGNAFSALKNFKLGSTAKPERQER
ncbi:MAG: hypothetical protein RJB38_1822 [Pseudomonadota bacterium]|jgi:uncharacterized protein